MKFINLTRIAAEPSKLDPKTKVYTETPFTLNRDYIKMMLALKPDGANPAKTAIQLAVGNEPVWVKETIEEIKKEGEPRDG